MSAAVYNSHSTDNTLPFYLRYLRGIPFKRPIATNFNTAYRRFHLLAFYCACGSFRGELFTHIREKINAWSLHLLKKKSAFQFLKKSKFFCDKF